MYWVGSTYYARTIIMDEDLLARKTSGLSADRQGKSWQVARLSTPDEIRLPRTITIIAISSACSLLWSLNKTGRLYLDACSEETCVVLGETVQYSFRKLEPESSKCTDPDTLAFFFQKKLRRKNGARKGVRHDPEEKTLL